MISFVMIFLWFSVRVFEILIEGLKVEVVLGVFGVFYYCRVLGYVIY